MRGLVFRPFSVFSAPLISECQEGRAPGPENDLQTRTFRAMYKVLDVGRPTVVTPPGWTMILQEREDQRHGKGMPRYRSLRMAM